MKKIAFIDRDGCMILEPHDFQVDDLNKIRLRVGVIPAMLRLVTAGYRLVMVTNQDGLGTTSFPQEEFDRCHDFILELFESQGIKFDDILICPHLPEEDCPCRKPRTGLLRSYLKDSGWQREASFVVGDRKTDMLLADNLGVTGYQVGNDLTWQEIAVLVIDQPRRATVTRKTKETAITVSLDLDGQGQAEIKSGIGFLDHMLESFTKHSGYNLKLSCEGDTWVDEHHTTEDIAITIGEAIKKALGDKRGIQRFGFLLPMDETLAQVAIDLSGRAYFVFEGSFKREAVGGLATELVPHFFHSLSDGLLANIHIMVKGENEHHKVEGMFKSVAKALALSTARPNPGEGDIPSTKGAL